MTTNEASQVIGQAGFELRVLWENTKLNDGTVEIVPIFFLYKDGRVQKESRHLKFSTGIQWMRREVERM